MLANTGTISFILYGVFILITIIAMAVAFFLIKKGNIEAGKLDKMIELFKYAVVSTAIATVTLIVADLFKEREQDVKELEYFDKYVDDVKKVDGVQERLLLAKYLAIVSPSGEMKKSWVTYYDTVKAEYQEYLNLKAEEEKIDSIQNPTVADMRKADSIKERRRMLEMPLSSVAVPAAKPTLYIQYCDVGKKNLMLEIQKKFDQNSWNVPGIEYKSGGCDNSIRYFHDEDRELANQANMLLNNKYNIRKISLRAPRGQLELWAEN